MVFVVIFFPIWSIYASAYAYKSWVPVTSIQIAQFLTGSSLFFHSLSFFAFSLLSLCPFSLYENFFCSSKFMWTWYQSSRLCCFWFIIFFVAFSLQSAFKVFGNPNPSFYASRSSLSASVSKLNFRKLGSSAWKSLTAWRNVSFSLCFALIYAVLELSPTSGNPSFAWMWNSRECIQPWVLCMWD